MVERGGVHVRRVENGYVTHEYETDKDWAWKGIGEVCNWLIKRDVEIREREQYEIYCKNAQHQQVTPMKFEEWKKNPIIAPIMTTTP